MKIINFLLLSTVAISNVNALPLEILKYLYPREAEGTSELIARSDLLKANSFSLNTSNSTNSTAGNSTNSSITSSGSSLPNIKVYSFSSDFSELFGNDTNSSNLEGLNISFNATAGELLSTLNIVDQGPNGNINATAVKQLTSKLSSGETSVGLGALLNAAGLNKVANLTYEEIANVSIAELNSTYLLEAYQKISDDLSGDDVDGVVIVQGSLYLEDTAFFLDLALNSSKPIVLTKEVTIENILTEGASNLYDSVLVAASEGAEERGSIVVIEKSIFSGFYARRVYSRTFNSNPQGILGSIYEGRVQWYYDASDVPTSDLHFDLEDANELPDVVILQNYEGFSADIINALGQSGQIDGLVLGTTQSSGAFSDEVESAIEELAENTPVVFATLEPAGTISADDLSSNSTIAGGILDPVKAKLLLQVSLASDYNTTEIKEAFSSVYGG